MFSLHLVGIGYIEHTNRSKLHVELHVVQCLTLKTWKYNCKKNNIEYEKDS